jgi:hypothetical protein
VTERNVSLLASVNYDKTVLKNVVFFLFGDSPASEYYVPTFRNTVSSIFIGGVSRKNNWDEFALVFILVKI